jgi:hypothetical protein
MSTPALGFTRKHASGQVRGGARKRGPAPGGLERAPSGQSDRELGARACRSSGGSQALTPALDSAQTRNANAEREMTVAL